MSFCYWQIRNNIDLVVGSVLSVCSFLLASFTLYNLLIIQKLDNKSRFKAALGLFIYTCLYGAYVIMKVLLAHLFKLLFGIAVYVSTISNMTENPDFDEYIQKYSRIFCVVDSLSTIVLHGLLLLVPYIWLYNILGYVVHVRQKIIQISKYLFLARFIKFYMFFRYVIYFALFTSELVVIKLEETFCEIINGMIIFESFLCMVLFLLCLFILLQHLQNLYFDSQRQKIQLLREFIMVAFFCLIRFIINFFFIILSDESCDFVNYHKQQLRHTVIYLGFGIVATHFVPIILLYNIFKLKLHGKEKSLIDTIIESSNSGEQKTETFLKREK